MKKEVVIKCGNCPKWGSSRKIHLAGGRSSLFNDIQSASLTVSTMMRIPSNPIYCPFLCPLFIYFLEYIGYTRSGTYSNWSSQVAPRCQRYNLSAGIKSSWCTLLDNYYHVLDCEIAFSNATPRCWQAITLSAVICQPVKTEHGNMWQRLMLINITRMPTRPNFFTWQSWERFAARNGSLVCASPKNGSLVSASDCVCLNPLLQTKADPLHIELLFSQ